MERMTEMMKTDLPTINIQQQLRSPIITPQALAWDGKNLWMSSRDLGTLYKIDAGRVEDHRGNRSAGSGVGGQR